MMERMKYQLVGGNAIDDSPMVLKSNAWESMGVLLYLASLAGAFVYQPESFVTWCTLLFVTPVILWDWSSHRIPNSVTYPTIAVGVAYAALTAGWAGLAWSISGLFIGGGLLLLAYTFQGMGAGDVKTLAALGALWGPWTVFHIFLFTALLGGVVSIGLLVANGLLMETVKRYWFMATTLLMTRRIIYVGPSARMGAIRFPYGVIISCGAVVSIMTGNVL